MFLTWELAMGAFKFGKAIAHEIQEIRAGRASLHREDGTVITGAELTSKLNDLEAEQAKTSADVAGRIAGRHPEIQ